MSAESGGSFENDPYQKQLTKLAENLNTLSPDDTAYDTVKKGLECKPLSMDDEFEIHEKLNSKGVDSFKYKELLKRAYTPQAINKAFAYSYLGVPLIDLIEPLIESLEFAANSVIEVVDHPARLGFVMAEVLNRRMILLLDELELDLVAPAEIQEMLNSGQKGEAEQIMSTLEPFERMVLERYLSNQIATETPSDQINLYEQAYVSALKKLRRPKSK